MLSRVANAVLWMARYVERAENLARFIDVTLNLQIDLPRAGGDQWAPLISATGDQEAFKERYGEIATEHNVIEFLTFDRENPNSIISVLGAARENARSIRETISSEAWEQLNAFYHFVRDANPDEVRRSPGDFYQAIKNHSHLFNGVTDGTMSHGEGWHFLNVGRRLERADKTSRILDVKYFTLLPNVSDVGSPVDDLQWSAVLRSVSGFEMFRKRYHLITVERVVDFLVLDREFPRAIQHCLIQANLSLHRISGSTPGAYINPAEQLLGRLQSDLAYRDVRSIIDQGLHEFVDSLQTQLNQVGDAITESFFDPLPTA